LTAFVFDLDGTICFGGRPVEPVILDAIDRVPAACPVVLASARHPVNIRDVVPEALYARVDVVGANGAIALSRGRPVAVRRLGGATTRAVLASLDALDCAYLAYGVDFVAMSPRHHALHAAIRPDLAGKLREGTDADAGTMVKVLALPAAGDSGPLAACRRLAGVAVQPHADGTFDVVAEGVDKRTGVAALGHGAPFFAAFGNDANDAPLFAVSRHTVGVGGSPAVRGARRLIPESDRMAEQVAAAIECLAARASQPGAARIDDPAEATERGA